MRYDLCPRNSVVGDAQLTLDGFSVRLVVPFVQAGEVHQRSFEFPNVKKFEFEAEHSVQRALPGLLNILEEQLHEGGLLYSGLCEDFGFFEISSGKVRLSEA